MLGNVLCLVSDQILDGIRRIFIRRSGRAFKSVWVSAPIVPVTDDVVRGAHPSAIVAYELLAAHTEGVSLLLFFLAQVGVAFVSVAKQVFEVFGAHEHGGIDRRISAHRFNDFVSVRSINKLSRGLANSLSPSITTER